MCHPELTGRSSSAIGSTWGAMFWFLVYASVAIIVAGGLFVWAGWVRERDAPGPDHPGWTALAAGVLWPVLVLALVQLGVLVMAAGYVRSALPGRHGRRATSQPAEPPYPLAR